MTDDDQGVRIPRQRRSEETRQKIMQAGFRLFEKEGFHATSSKKIAREAGVSVGSFYAYFKDKKHLLLEIIGEKLAAIHDLALKLSQSPELHQVAERDLVRLMIFQARDMHIASPEFTREIDILCHTDEDVCRFAVEKDAMFDATLVKLLESRRECLRVTDLEAAASLVHGSIQFLLHKLQHFPGSIPEERAIEALVDMICTYLFKPDCHTPPEKVG